jgi:Cytosolic carboxypeptidase N-terminal domain
MNALYLAFALTVHADFEGGSFEKAESVSKQHLRVAVKGETDQAGRNRQASWYYFRIDDASKSELIIDLVGLPGEYNYQPNRGAISDKTPPVNQLRPADLDACHQCRIRFTRAEAAAANRTAGEPLLARAHTSVYEPEPRGVAERHNGSRGRERGSHRQERRRPGTLFVVLRRRPASENGLAHVPTTQLGIGLVMGQRGPDSPCRVR